MPIKDRDGNIYKIQKPNPVMKEQEFWNKSKLKLINFDFINEVVSDEGEVVIKDVINKNGPIPKKEIENILVLKPEPIIENKPIVIENKPEPIIENKPIVNKPIVKEITDREKKIKEMKIQVYCLPVFDSEVKDDVYGDKYLVKSYGDKFTFEAIMVEEEDLFCKFWTNTKIPSSSIVYPKNQSRRWWQVQNLESMDNGYMITAAPTQANPDFTD
jgi:hypothetical protein